MAHSTGTRGKSIAGAVALALMAPALAPTPATAATAAKTARVSVATDGTQGSGTAPGISADGRFVAFTSASPNLVPGNTGPAKGDTFVHDRQTGATTRVSVASDGTEANFNSNGPGSPAISATGRYVAFAASGTNLVVGDNNNQIDVFLRDRQAGTTSRVSRASDGTESNGRSETPAISADGRYVAFVSTASNLTSFAGQGNGPKVFRHDTQTGETVLVSANAVVPLQPAAGPSVDPSISADGRYVAFQSSARDLVNPPDDATETSGSDDVYVRDMDSGTTTSVSITGEADSRSMQPEISDNGRYVAFSSNSRTMAGIHPDDRYDVFVKDLQGGMFHVSVANDETALGENSSGPTISGDGRYVAFSASAKGVLIRDRQSLTTTAALTLDGTPASGRDLALDASGRRLAFASTAANLVANDTNGADDVFVRDAKPPLTVSIGDATVVEGDAGTRAVFTVSLSRPSTSYVWVNYATAKGTATGTDFTARSGSLTFYPGTTSLNVKVAITPDTLPEGNETFSVKLSAPSGATIADGTGLGTIIDND